MAALDTLTPVRDEIPGELDGGDSELQSEIERIFYILKEISKFRTERTLPENPLETNVVNKNRYIELVSELSEYLSYHVEDFDGDFQYKEVSEEPFNFYASVIDDYRKLQGGIHFDSMLTEYREMFEKVTLLIRIIAMSFPDSPFQELRRLMITRSLTEASYTWQIQVDLRSQKDFESAIKSLSRNYRKPFEYFIFENIVELIQNEKTINDLADYLARNLDPAKVLKILTALSGVVYTYHSNYEPNKISAQLLQNLIVKIREKDSTFQKIITFETLSETLKKMLKEHEFNELDSKERDPIAA